MRFDIHQFAVKAEELFHKIDTDGNGSLSEKELKEAFVKAASEALV